MYRIAVVEDQQHDAQLLMALLDRYAREKQVRLTATWIDSAFTFLDTYHKQYDIVLFDISMPGLDGMSAARELRAQDSDIVIAFLTSLAQYAVEGYEVEAADFILKPVTYPLLELKLPRLLKRCSRRDDTFILQAGGTSVHLHASDLLYVEIFDHKIRAQTLNGPLYAYGTLKELEEILPRGFFRISNQTIVNLQYVRVADNTSALVGERKFSVSRSRRKDFMAALHSATKRSRPKIAGEDIHAG